MLQFRQRQIAQSDAFRDRMRDTAADHLVCVAKRHVFAYQVVGKIGGRGEAERSRFAHPLGAHVDVRQHFSPVIDAAVFDVLTLEGSVNARNHIGGTAPAQVRAAIARGRTRLG